MDDPGIVDGIVLGITIFVYIFTAVVASTLIIVLICVVRGVRRVHLRERLPGSFDDSEQFFEEEQTALELMDDNAKQSYLMAKRWIQHNPPNSADTDISLSQYLTIQEKAVGAWEFTFDILQQPMVYVHNRTEIDFRSQGAGSDGMCCVQTNLPLPSQKDVYYWEMKVYDMSPETKLAVGLTTKPYPGFRFPGMHRYSVSYESQAIYRLNQPFSGISYGRQWQRGDVVGVGYRTRTGSVFFTHNGKKLDDIVHGMKVNLFPTVGATGPANVYINLGQDGFVFIQANAKEWGLAPAQGSLAPPPAYGDQKDSLLLERTGMDRLVGPSSLHANIDLADGTTQNANENGDIPALNGINGISNNAHGCDNANANGFYELVQEEAPPYVRRRDSDDAHQSLNVFEIRTPPGTPPQVPINISRESENSDASGEERTTSIHSNNNSETCSAETSSSEITNGDN